MKSSGGDLRRYLIPVAAMYAAAIAQADEPVPTSASQYLRTAPSSYTDGTVHHAISLIELGDEMDAARAMELLVQKEPRSVAAHTFLAEFYLTHPEVQSSITSLQSEGVQISQSSDRIEFPRLTFKPTYSSSNRIAPLANAHLTALTRVRDGDHGLQYLLQHTNSIVRTAAAETLAKSKLERRVDRLLQALEKETENRSALIKALGETGSEQVYSALVLQFADVRKGNNRDSEKNALWAALRMLPSPQSTAELLSQALEGEDWQQSLAVHSLARRSSAGNGADQGDGLSKLIATALQPGPFPLGTWQALADQKIPGAAAQVESIRNALESGDRRVVERALVLAGNAPLHSFQPQLIALLDARKPNAGPRSERVVALLTPPETPELLRAMSRILLTMPPPQKPDNVQRYAWEQTARQVSQKLSSTIAETTESLRPVFAEVVDEVTSAGAPATPEAIERAAVVVRSWKTPAVIHSIVSAVARLVEGNKENAAVALNNLQYLSLDEEDTSRMLSWISNDTLNTQLRLHVARVMSQRGVNPQMRNWAIAELSSGDNISLQAALQIVYGVVQAPGAAITADEVEAVRRTRDAMEEEVKKRSAEGLAKDEAVSAALDTANEIIRKAETPDPRSLWFLQ